MLAVAFHDYLLISCLKAATCLIIFRYDSANSIHLEGSPQPQNDIYTLLKSYIYIVCITDSAEFVVGYLPTE